MLFEYLYDFLNLLFPEECVLCHFPLMGKEKEICNSCFLKLPRVSDFSVKKDEIKNIFVGRVKIKRADSFLVYAKRNAVQKLLQELKYNGNEKLAFYLGACFAQEKLNSGFFDQIDLLLSVPLHPIKQKQRGYNQSELIALGVQKITKIPYCSGVIRKVEHTTTQTKKKRADRQDSAQQAYIVENLSLIKEKKILIIDDVLTTGATLEACASTLQEEVSEISFATLAYSRKS